MKKTITLLFALSITSSLIYGGGKKMAVPTEAEIIDIPTPIVPPPSKISPVPLYVGLGIIAAGVSRDCDCANDRIKDTTYGGILRIGYDYNDLFGAEFRYLKSSLEKDFSTVEHYGVFLKPQYHTSDQMNIYGLIGYGKTIATGCTPLGDLEKSKLSFGIGFEYDLSGDKKRNGIYPRAFDGQGDQEKGWGIWFDFQHLFNKENIFQTNANVITFGITYDF